MVTILGFVGLLFPAMTWDMCVLQSCPTVCKPMGCSLPSSSVHEILQARILEWVVMPSSGHLPHPGAERETLWFPALAGGFLTTSFISRTLKGTFLPV